MPGTVLPMEENSFHICLQTIREVVFSKYYKNTASTDVVKITSENFDEIPKGTTAFFIPDKDLFLKIYKSIDSLDKTVSEDIRLFREIVNKQIRLVKDSKITVYYNQRDGFAQNIKHLFERGPRFIDYYLSFPNKYKILIIAYLVAMLITLTLLIINPLAVITILLSLLVFVALLLAGFQKRFFNIIVCLPVVVLSFSLGLFHGIFLKFIKS